MNRKASLYAVIGGVVGAVVTMAVCSVMPIGAQNGNATFGEITCTGLKVVDAEGIGRIVLDTLPNNGRIEVTGAMGSVWLATNNNDGGIIWVRGKLGGVWLDDGDDEYSDGGRVKVYSRSDYQKSATLGVNEHGGSVEFYGKGIDKTRAAMGVNEYGNGAVNTWDKNGYRLATLK